MKDKVYFGYSKERGCVVAFAIPLKDQRLIAETNYIPAWCAHAQENFYVSVEFVRNTTDAYMDDEAVAIYQWLTDFGYDIEMLNREQFLEELCQI